MAHITSSKRSIFKRIIIFSVLFLLLPTTSFSMKTKFYLCIGSFRDLPTLKKYYAPFVSGNVPVLVSRNYEKGKPFYHLLYGRYYTSDRKARTAIPQLRTTLMKTSKLPLNDIWVFDKYLNPFDPYAKGGSRTISGITEPDEYVYYHRTQTYQTTVINRNGGGEETEDSANSDTSDFTVLQVIPEGTDISGATPIIVLFNQKLLLPSIIGHIQILSEGKQIPGYLRVIPYNENRAAICFTPIQGAWPDTNITLLIDSSLKSVSAGSLDKAVNASFRFTAPPVSSKGSYNFETNDTAAYKIDGDGAILTDVKDIIASYEGRNFASLSTGSRLLSDKESIGQKSSFLSLTLPSTNGFSLAYNLLSSEFNEFNDSKVGDIAFVTLWGRDFQKIDIITSINRVKNNNTGLPYKRFASLPEMGDSYAGQSGWNVFEKQGWKHSGQSHASIVISNIKEPVFNSILLIDDIKAGK